MMTWIQQFRRANPKTRWFIFNWAIYILLMIVTTIYCYARLDYVRSYALKPTTEENKNS